MLKEGEYVQLKNYMRKIKLRLIIYSGFVSILVPENNKNKTQMSLLTFKLFIK